MNFKKLFIFLIVILLTFNSWLLSKQLNLGHDISYRFIPIVEDIHLPFTWNNVQIGDGMGEYVVKTLWSYPSEFIFESFFKIGIPYWVQIKILMLLPFILISLVGIYKLSRLFKADWLVSTIFYLINTYTILLLDGSQMNIALAYSIFPLSFYLFLKHRSIMNVQSLIYFILSVWIMGIFDLRMVFMLALLIFIYSCADLMKNINNSKLLIKLSVFYIKTGFSALIFLLLMNLYVILPSIFSRLPGLPAGYGEIGQVHTLSFASLVHTFSLQQPHWYKNVFGVIREPMWYFSFIPILAFSVILLRKKKNEVVFWFLVALTGIFLSKGSNPPFSYIYSWLFTKLPGFSMFRDPTKFFFLITISYSILVGITVRELENKFKSKLSIFTGKSSLVSLLVIIYLVVLVYPSYTGKLTGSFSKIPNENSYWELADYIGKENEFSRSIWLPTKNPLGYVSYNHPSVDTIYMTQKRPFATGIVGSYELFNFIREAPYMGELFDIAGIKYIVYPYPDPRREELKQDNIDYYFAFLDQLENLPWIEKQINNPPVAVLQTKKNQDHIFLADNTWFVVGSDALYKEISKVQNLTFSKNALIFAEEQPNFGKVLQENPHLKVLLHNKSEADLAATFIDQSRFIFPAEILNLDPNDNGWWKRETADLIWWRNFLQTKYQIDNLDFDFGGGWAVAEREKDLKELVIDRIPPAIKGDKLLVRAMVSSKGGKIEIFQAGRLISEIDTGSEREKEVDIKLTGYKDIPDQIFTYEEADFRWFVIDNLPVSLEPIKINAKGDINVINSIVFVSEKEWEEINGYFNDSNRYGEVIRWDELDEGKKRMLFAGNGHANVSYKRISPTHYEVKVEGLKKPTTLAFSETYDPLWTMTKVDESCHSGDRRSIESQWDPITRFTRSRMTEGGCEVQNSYPLYSLINGFPVEHDGEYDIYFTPQKYVLPGLIISGITLLTVVGLVSFLYYKRSKKV